MHFKTGKLLNDVRKRCHHLLEVRDSSSLEEFLVQLDPRTLAERHFEVIGEALGRLLKADPFTAARITGIDEVIGLRNRIAHGYDDDISLEKLWMYMVDNVPILLGETESLLAEYLAEYGPNPDIVAFE